MRRMRANDLDADGVVRVFELPLAVVLEDLDDAMSNEELIRTENAEERRRVERITPAPD